MNKIEVVDGVCTHLVVIGGIYKHCKGKLYKVVDIVHNSDDCTKRVVIYKQLEDSDFKFGTKWARDYEEFIDDHPKLKVPRFVLVGRDT